MGGIDGEREGLGRKLGAKMCPSLRKLNSVCHGRIGIQIESSAIVDAFLKYNVASFSILQDVSW